MNIEYVLGQEQHTSSWAKFYVKGLDKWPVKEDFEELPPFSPRTEDEASAPETVNKLQSKAKEKETLETQWKQWLNLGLIALNVGTQSRKQTNQGAIDDYAELSVNLETLGEEK